MNPTTLIAFALFATAAAASAAPRVGLGPIELPGGDASHSERLAAAIRQGAAPAEVVPAGACLADELRCLAAAAKQAGVEAVLTARIAATERGYKFHLRRVTAAGDVRGEEQGEVQGGPLDLAGSLEGASCKLIAGAPCAGELAIAADAAPAGQRVLVDGRDAGVLPLQKTLSLPVGRHAVRIGDREERVSISNGRTAQLAASQLAEAPGVTAPAAGAEAPTVLHSAAFTPVRIAMAEPTSEGRSIAGRALIAAGIGLIAAGAGFGLYAQVEQWRIDGRPRANTLTTAASPDNGSARRAGLAAAALAATGVGAIVAGGVVFALTPTGAAVSGEF
jgi:hypothetical protein